MAPSTDWREIVPPGEDARLRELALQLRELQKKRARGGKASRALHAKSNLNVEAELTILPELPEHARVALFAEPKTYRAYVRFSNGAGASQPDRKPDVRGVAVKVLGVAGKKVIPGMEDATTQDFLMIRSAATPFRNAEEFVAVVRTAANPLNLFSFLGVAGFSRGLGILRSLSKGLALPMGSLAATRYYSALPIAFGPYAVRYAIKPHAEDGAPVAGDLGEELAGRLRNGPVTYDFQVQYFVDEAKTPIEDASVEWTEEIAPFVTVARLTLSKQDVSSPRGKRVSDFIEALSFDPWHAITELRPLGNMMRARNHAYRESTQERGAAKEPDGTESLD
jgi:hypothetical protein